MDKKPPLTSSPICSTLPSTTRGHPSTKTRSSEPRHAGDLFAGYDGSVKALSQPKAQRLPELDPQQAQLIAGVFTRLKSIYGHLFSSNWRTDEQAKMAQFDWLSAFKRHAFTTGDINEALDYCADRVTNMPNLPTFIDIAKSVKTRRRAEQARAGQPPALPESEAQAAARKAEEAIERARYREIGLTGISQIKNIFGEKNR